MPKRPPTEAVLEATRDIDRWSVERIVRAIHDEDRHAWAKKVQVKGFIRDKEYRLVKEGSRVDRVILGESAQTVRLRYAPHKRQRLKEDIFDLRELEFSGLSARGRKMGSKPVAGVSLEQPS